MNIGERIGVSIDATSLLSVPEQLRSLIADPRSNPTAAVLLFGIVAVAVLILLTIVIMWINSLPEDDEDGLTAVPYDRDMPTAVERLDVAPAESAGPRPALPLALGITVAAVIGLVIVGVTGYTSSTDSVCVSCHEQTVHTESGQKDPLHANVECVQCHELGSVIGRYAADVPSRLVHFADGLSAPKIQTFYGQVSSTACLRCHDADIEKVTLDAISGIRMSHAEPVAASAACTDCHTMSAGFVGPHNVGMKPCIRCHDSKLASAECETCHDKKTSLAARARSTSFQSVQVPQVRCGGCHNEARECDSCHGGTRMPHSTEFMGMAHARAGAVSYWYQDGKACVKCHNETRRPCEKCHTSGLLGSGHPPVLAVQHRAAVASGCDSCHIRNAVVGNRDFCVDLCHNAAAVAESPR